MRWTYLLLFAFVACGGEAVIDPAGSGGASSTTTGATTTGSTSTGAPGCTQGDCPPNSVCIDGTCRLSCDGDLFTPCPQGQICDPCATASCAGCLDCVGACMDAQPGQCDDHDDCNMGELCVFQTGTCAPECTDGGCADPNLACSPCATGSCPGCEDCRDVCLPI